MPVKMQPHQLAFWRELLAPFRPDQLSETSRGGKKLTYVDKRSITNRLDSVCGPHGWYPEYEATARGYKCRLYISVPMSVEGTEVFMHKEDGAGFEEMGSTNKQTGEFEYDVDNDEKSGYTNALRRAAQDAWGIGRYLYGKGIPTFLDPNASASLPPIQPGPNPAVPPRELADKTTPPPSTRDLPPAQNGQRQYDNFKIPKPGTSVFAWCKEMEKVFETKIVDGMQSKGEEEGWGKVFKDWNEQQVNTICIGAIKYIRELPTYKGQFEHLFPGGVPNANIPTTSGSGPNTPAPAAGVNVADLRKKLVAAMQNLFAKQTGAQPDNTQLKSVFNAVAVASKDEHGHTGQVPESLSKLTDVVWVTNMLTLVADETAAAVAKAAQGDAAGDPDIPF